MRILYFSLIIWMILFSGCVKNSFYKDTQNMVLHDAKNEKTLLELDLKNAKILNTYDSCISDAYMFRYNDKHYDDLFGEYIDMKIGCSWNGFSRGYFEDLLSRKEKIDSMKLIKRFEINHYEFSQYKLDDKYLINMIFIWDHTTTTFIVDTSGVFTNELLQKLNSMKKLPITTEKYKLKSQVSLVKENWFRHFFHKDDTQKKEIIIKH